MSFMMEEGRGKKEDVTLMDDGRILRCKMVEGRWKSILELPNFYFLILYHPILDLSSCILLPVSLLILR